MTVFVHASDMHTCKLAHGVLAFSVSFIQPFMFVGAAHSADCPNCCEPGSGLSHPGLRTIPPHCQMHRLSL